MRYAIFILFIVILASCKEDYPGYKKDRNGIYFQLLEIGEDTIHVKEGDFIVADIKYITMNDSVFFSGTRKFQLQNTKQKGSIEPCFTMLSLEDRALFIISADSFFLRTLNSKRPRFLPDSSMMKVDIKILSYQPADEYIREKDAFLKWIDDFNAYEKEILSQFIQQKKMNIQPTASGLYYIQRAKGNGNRVEQGSVVEVHYEGRFLDGKFFDSTKKRSESYTFVYGQEMQVIKGLEEAIGKMEEGEKAVVIMPSELAFGAEGSSTGIIPPYTSLLFEIEIVSVKK